MSSFSDLNSDPHRVGLAAMNIIIPLLQLYLWVLHPGENERQNSLPPLVALTTICNMSHYLVAPSYLISLSKPLSFCTVIQKDLSFDTLTSSSQPWNHSAPLLPPSPSCHQHDRQFPVLQPALYLTALRSLSSLFITPFSRLQTDNPLIHRLLLLSPETGRAPFHTVISLLGIFSENLPRLTGTHTPRAAFLSPDRRQVGAFDHTFLLSLPLCDQSCHKEVDAGLLRMAASCLSLNSTSCFFTFQNGCLTPQGQMN